MSNNNNKSIDYGDLALIICLTILIILFAGDPDLMDAIISKITG